MLAGIHNIHFIGIGGAGMSALAHVLCERGFHVSGSDKNAGGICEKLKALGAVVYQGHASGQVNSADAVVISSAIHPDNCELVAAKEQGIKVMHRSDVLAELLNHADGVAVAGAHGKTTTSAMLSCIAAQGGIDPTIVIGGGVKNLRGNAPSGKSRFVISEGGGSEGSFFKFYPLFAPLNTNAVSFSHLPAPETGRKIVFPLLLLKKKKKKQSSAVNRIIVNTTEQKTIAPIMY